LSAKERADLSAALHELGREVGIDLPEGTTPEALTDALGQLDARLGTPDPGRDPGPLRKRGPLQRQLRALLWKQDVPGYGARGLNPIEMVEKLCQRLAQTGVLKEQPRE
jgi:hypothetical protein